MPGSWEILLFQIINQFIYSFIYQSAVHCDQPNITLEFVIN